jgi:hypothetical protein
MTKEHRDLIVTGDPDDLGRLDSNAVIVGL